VPDTSVANSSPSDTSAADPGTATPGLVPSGDGAGDSLFPDLGNPGVDVVDYAIDLAYDSANGSLSGGVTLTINITSDLTEVGSSFTLDSTGPAVSAVEVDGVAATFVEEPVELRITPPTPISAGTRVVVVVHYSVVPDSTQSPTGLPSGWFNTAGGSYVLNEPDGARTWLPSNDHPSDKATYTFSVTVPTGTTVVANGVLQSSEASAAGTTWVWRQEQPMATYLILLVTGAYDIVDGTGPNDLPLTSAVLTADHALMQPFLDSIAEEIDFFDDWFGPYPLAQYGIAITDSAGGLAMETQGRSMFSRDDLLSGELGYIEQLLLSHELSHQWFGDAVTPAEWSDIWLNESFATYAQWMWLEHVGLSSVQQEADSALDGRQDGIGEPTGSPSVDGMFGFNSYDGGAIVLHALRMTIGDDDFFKVLQTWVSDNVGQSRFTSDFIALAERISGRDLTALFDDWLYATQVPAAFPSAQTG
jgi:aminopeptidase N